MRKILLFVGMAIFAFVANAQTQFSVTFNVDMKAAIDSALFDPTTDSLLITGSYLGWAEPGTDSVLAQQKMTDADDDSIYTITVTVDSGEVQYKYFKNAGWSNGEWDGDPNRVVIVSSDTTFNDVWAVLETSAVKTIPTVSVKVGPNPVSNVLTVSADKNYNIAVYDITGKEIISLQMTNNSANIDFSGFQSGTYFVKIYNGNETGTYKVIKK